VSAYAIRWGCAYKKHQPPDHTNTHRRYASVRRLRVLGAHVQRYLDPLLAHVENGDIDPSFVLTHRTSLERAPEMYETFNDKEDGCIKVTMTP